MVETRSQKKKKLLEMAVGSHVGYSHEKDTTLALMEKMLLRMEAMETSWENKMGLFTQGQETNAKMKEEFDELRTQHEYIDLMCTQLDIRVKEVEEARDQGIA